MRRSLIILAFTAALGACAEATTTTTTRTTATGTEIALRDGQNCFDNKCFRYDAARNAVAIQGRVPIAAGNVSGFVSPATFDELYHRALRARERSSGRGG